MAKIRKSVVPNGTRNVAAHTYLAMNRQATVNSPCRAFPELNKGSIRKEVSPEFQFFESTFLGKEIPAILVMDRAWIVKAGLLAMAMAVHAEIHMCQA